MVAWLCTALGAIFIYLAVGQLLVLFVTPAGMSSSPSQLVRDFVGQYGQGIGLLLITAGQWIRGRKPRLKLRGLRRFGKATLLIALIAATQTTIGPNVRSVVPVFAWGGTTHKVTLTEAAIDMAAAYDYMGVYQYRELYWKTGFGESIKTGSTDEDDAPNDFYHFYDPASGSGLAWRWYFPIRALLDGGSVTEPTSGQFPNAKPGEFPNAYIRARYGGAYNIGDELNWYGALKAYDYTPESKLVAYKRLGHVVHLLEDMAEPDHANLVGHPGSSKSRSEIYQMVGDLVGLIVGLAAGGIVGGLASWILGKARARLHPDHCGIRWRSCEIGNSNAQSHRTSPLNSHLVTNNRFFLRDLEGFLSFRITSHRACQQQLCPTGQLKKCDQMKKRCYY